MHVSFTLGAAGVAAALAVSSASANVADSKALLRLESAPAALIVNADFVQGHEAIAGVSAHESVARTAESKLAAERYFDFDVIITLGALAIASGAFVAAGIAGSRRRAGADQNGSREGWREQILQALEADLAQFTVSLKHAA